MCSVELTNQREMSRIRAEIGEWSVLTQGYLCPPCNIPYIAGYPIYCKDNHTCLADSGNSTKLFI